MDDAFIKQLGKKNKAFSKAAEDYPRDAWR